MKKYPIFNIRISISNTFNVTENKFSSTLSANSLLVIGKLTSTRIINEWDNVEPNIQISYTPLNTFTFTSEENTHKSVRREYK